MMALVAGLEVGLGQTEPPPPMVSFHPCRYILIARNLYIYIISNAIPVFRTVGHSATMNRQQKPSWMWWGVFGGKGEGKGGVQYFGWSGRGRGGIERKKKKRIRGLELSFYNYVCSEGNMAEERIMVTRFHTCIQMPVCPNPQDLFSMLFLFRSQKEMISVMVWMGPSGSGLSVHVKKMMC